MALQIDFITDAINKLKQAFADGFNESNGVNEKGHIKVLSGEKYLRASLSVYDIAGLVFDMAGYNSMTLHVTNRAVTSRISVEVSSDMVDWARVQLTPLNCNPGSMDNIFYSTNNESGAYGMNRSGRFVRIREQSSTAPTIITINLTQAYIGKSNSHPVLISQGAFRYNSPAGGITNTNAVAITSNAISPAFVNAITSINLSNGGTVGTEVIIRSATTITDILWRGWIGPNQSLSHNPIPMIKGTGGQQLELLLSTGGDVKVFANIQGLAAIRGI